MKRRHFLVAAPAAALLPMPAIAAGEHPNNKVRRLAREIMETLRDPQFIGFNRLTITPNMVGYCENDPETRITYAIDDIRRAIAEQHPDWKFQVEDRSIGAFVGTSRVESAPRRRGIVLYASDERGGPEKASLLVDYL